MSLTTPVRWPRTNTAATLCLLALLAASAAEAELTLVGLDEAQEKNVRLRTALATAPCELDQVQVQQLLRLAQRQVPVSLEALGYYNSTQSVTASSFSDNCWSVTLTVEPGPPVRYTSVLKEVLGEGENDEAFAAVLRDHPIARDEVLHHGRYRALKSALRNTANRRGYFEGYFDAQRIAVDPQTNTAELELRFITGPRFRIGELRIEQNTVEPDLLSKFIELREGQPYLASDITGTHRNLLQSGYFQLVEVRAVEVEAKEGVIPVEIKLTPAKSRLYTGGIGYSTDLGGRARLAYEARRINSAGHKLKSDLVWSSVRSGIDATYQIPRGNRQREVVEVAASVTREDTETASETREGLSLRWVDALSERWLRAAFVDIQHQEYRVGENLDSSLLVIPGVRYWNFADTSDARPASGYSLVGELRGTSDVLGSDTSFLQLTARGRFIHSLNDRTRLLLRGVVGITAKDSLNALPPSLRFYAGGDNSIRGYDFESIGPKDDEGNIVGGNQLVTASIELDYQFLPNWAAAVFYDTGSAFRDNDPELFSGAGVGIRRLTPLGPLRLDVAWPLDERNSPRIHFSIGTDL